MEQNVKDIVVVVTGAANGIGFQMADNFLQKEARAVLILDVNEEQGRNAEKLLNDKHGSKKATFIKCDVTTDVDVVTDKILRTHNNVDVLINNAGVVDEKSFEKTIDINLTAVIAWTEKFYKYMRKDKGGNGGTIINVSSIYGFRIIPYIPYYHASKFGVLGYSKSLGDPYNFKRTGVRVVAVCPGLTTTNLASAPKPREDETKEEFYSDLEQYEWQAPDAVGRGTVEVFQKAESGSAWLVEGSRPAVQI